MTETSTALRTPLHALHKALKASLTQFAGYEMPVRYEAGFINEHLHTRSKAGLFDVSHMGVLKLSGDENLSRWLETLVPSDIQGLATGKVRYTVLLNEDGGILDDLTVAKPTSESSQLLLVVNAGGKQADIAHLRSQLEGKAEVEWLSHLVLLALQGPLAAEVLGVYSTAPAQLKFMECGEFELHGYGPAFISRTGYTGEDGFEIALPDTGAESFVRALLQDDRVLMIGLGARDTLRLEAGLPLYGHDLSTDITPVEAGLSWIIPKARREMGGFPGFAQLQQQWSQGSARKRVGLRPKGRAIAREGSEILLEGQPIGLVTSGGFSPSLQAPIAMGLVQTAAAAIGTTVQLLVRAQGIDAEIVGLPFVPHHYAR